MDANMKSKKKVESLSLWVQICDELKEIAKDKIVLTLLIITTVFLGFSVFYLLHGSIYFFTDIGRDFLLLDDMAQKKFVLIGARTSLAGVFHGPLWHYINLPAFLLGGGNPLVVAWGWFFFTILCLLSLWYVGKKLFNNQVAALAVMLVSIHVIYLEKALTNPAGALFVMPLFIYAIIRYAKTSSPKYLLLHLFLGGLIIQFEMMIGVPLFIVSTLFCFYLWIHSKKFLHIFCFAILAIPLSSFALFELRHNFSEIRSVLEYVHGGLTVGTQYSAKELLLQRVDLLYKNGIGLFPTDHVTVILNALGVIVFVGYGISVYLKKKIEDQDKTIFILLFYYVAFFIVSLVLKSSMLFHYYWPFFPIPLLAFAAISSKIKKPFSFFYIAIVLLAIGSGLTLCKEQVQFARDTIGKKEDDWIFLTQNFAPVFQGSEDAFGYFLYAPDIYAYEQKYAMSYLTKQHPEKHVAIYAKEPVTYLVIAPPSGWGIEKSSPDWKRDKIRLTRTPDETLHMAAGYTIEKYNLTNDELKVPIDDTIQDWIFFR